MIQIPFESIVDRILKSTSLTKSEVLRMVEKKKSEMKGLVSDEGAAYIIANDLGVKFLPDGIDEFLPLDSVVPGLKRVNVNGRITNIFPIRSFESKGRSGTVGNFVIGDGSGSVRVVLWNDLTKLLSEARVKVGDVVSISNAYSRQGLRDVEVHLSNRSRLSINPEGVSVPEVSVKKQVSSGDVVVASVTHVFDRVSFFDVCPECRRRVSDGSCSVHGVVEPVKNLVVSLNLDNGGEVVRAVLFGNVVSSVSGFSPSEAHDLFSAGGSNDDLINSLRSSLLGRVVRAEGKLRVNDFSGRQEIVVNNLELNINPVSLINELLG